MRMPLDVKDERYGMLTAVKQVSVKPTKWLFKCDCGNTKPINLNDVRSGKISSCGCLRKKADGMSHLPIHQIWVRMQSHETCKSWRNFDNFHRDMGNRPKNKFLCRHDLAKPYSKRNCYWGTKSQRSKNLIWVVHGNEYPTAKAAANKYNKDAQTIINWCKGYTRGGWTYPPVEGCYVIEQT